MVSSMLTDMTMIQVISIAPEKTPSSGIRKLSLPTEKISINERAAKQPFDLKKTDIECKNWILFYTCLFDKILSVIEGVTSVFYVAKPSSRQDYYCSASF